MLLSLWGLHGVDNPDWESHLWETECQMSLLCGSPMDSTQETTGRAQGSPKEEWGKGLEVTGRGGL